MCARYEIFFNNEVASKYQKALKSIQIKDMELEKEAFPSETLPVITKNGMEFKKWGYPLTKQLLINARAETILEKRLFKGPFERSRCIVPCVAYYEWNPTKTKMRMEARAPMSLAGIIIEDSFVVITVDSNEQMQPIHTRMPVVLSEESIERYLLGDVLEAKELLVPFKEEMNITAVTPEQLRLF
ncbi:SOS response-associated peptidase family protein [Guggenheimella bovis]